ncbi:SDR family NAD(P)-dependent oxidoreductase [Novosphingobium malaysiense]|uniref:Short-chain dehydrogenase n=1 Tax=Novosphingobium malaysiense TaxID=1348853 RepID=A0A0B1ZH23_9SPHN|nr:SDR family oxidoreductase [Novosphingobium malaysiense]KHK90411.1 short-chain dehydrogenase [Novosphingobium malaysiense]
MGKVVVVTGAGQGLGRALSQAFAERGDSVVMLGRTLSKVQEAAGQIDGAAMAVQCDVSSPESVTAAFAEIAKSHGGIDVLINNAATYEPCTVAEATDSQIYSMINTNLIGPILCCRSAIPMLNEGASIINVSSESVEMPFAMLSLYQTSKAGLERFSKSLADELEEMGVRVTTVRAGSMTEEGKAPPNWQPETAMRFVEACQKRGLADVMGFASELSSVVGTFTALADLPSDLTVKAISIGARRPLSGNPG